MDSAAGTVAVKPAAAVVKEGDVVRSDAQQTRRADGVSTVEDAKTVATRLLTVW